MAVVITTRFEVAPSEIDQMLASRNALVSAVRQACPGLTEARLARVDERVWIDAWRWDSKEHLQAAVEANVAGKLPEAPAAFAFTKNAGGESAEIVDER